MATVAHSQLISNVKIWHLSVLPRHCNSCGRNIGISDKDAVHLSEVSLCGNCTKEGKGTRSKKQFSTESCSICNNFFSLCEREKVEIKLGLAHSGCFFDKMSKILVGGGFSKPKTCSNFDELNDYLKKMVGELMKIGNVHKLSVGLKAILGVYGYLTEPSVSLHFLMVKIRIVAILCEANLHQPRKCYSLADIEYFLKELARREVSGNRLEQAAKAISEASALLPTPIDWVEAFRAKNNQGSV
jgi:hypothetical protein